MRLLRGLAMMRLTGPCGTVSGDESSEPEPRVEPSPSPRPGGDDSGGGSVVEGSNDMAVWGSNLWVWEAFWETEEPEQSDGAGAGKLEP